MDVPDTRKETAYYSNNEIYEVRGNLASYFFTLLQNKRVVNTPIEWTFTPFFGIMLMPLLVVRVGVRNANPYFMPGRR